MIVIIDIRPSESLLLNLISAGNGSPFLRTIVAVTASRQGASLTDRLTDHQIPVDHREMSFEVRHHR